MKNVLLNFIYVNELIGEIVLTLDYESANQSAFKYLNSLSRATNIDTFK